MSIFIVEDGMGTAQPEHVMPHFRDLILIAWTG